MQAWKGRLLTIVADFAEHEIALQLCSQADVSLQWDGGVCKFEFEVEVLPSASVGRHVAHFQPIAEQPDQTQLQRPEDRLRLSYQVKASTDVAPNLDQSQQDSTTEPGTQTLSSANFPPELLMLLPNGIPPLPEGYKWHFFISKHELYGKEKGEIIARALQHLGFKVWLSQDFLTPDEDAMRRGVAESVVVLLIMTTGIFVSANC